MSDTIDIEAISNTEDVHSFAAGSFGSSTSLSGVLRASVDAKKKRRVHPTAKVKGNWSPKEDALLIQ
jgi:hypothetical protein